MKKFFVCLVILSSFCSSSFADEGVEAALEKMFALTNMQDMLDNVHAQMKQAFANQADDSNIPEDRKAIYAQHQLKVEALIKESMSWDNMKKPIIAAYAQVYTKAEVDELNDFYQSPLGQKMLQKMPELMHATMQAVTEYSKEMQPKLAALNQELKKELENLR